MAIKLKKEKKTKSATAELISTVLWAVGLAFVFRTFIFQPFHIPSGSMQPGLVKGDYIITSKYTLGYGQFAAVPLPFPVKTGRLFERKPERGDVIVFRPIGNSKNFIKRLIGLPGDQVQMINGRLHLNGTRIQTEAIGIESREDRYGNDDETTVLSETLKDKNYKIYDDLKNSPEDNTSVFTVPAGHYFFMGDNRDHSADSRVPTPAGAGYVPAENLMGKAEFVLLSVSNDFVLYKPWTWGKMRSERFFKGIR